MGLRGVQDRPTTGSTLRVTFTPGKDIDGEFTKGPFNAARPCQSCKGERVTFQIWESADGAYEDEKYTCQDCGETWWIDGIDS